MVAKITFPRSAEKALQYNERKVSKGIAVCLGGDNCLTEPQLLSIEKKLSILQHRNVLNDRAVTKTIHISLNFGLSENLSQKKLTNVASFYMQKIGFGEQPYFVYQHHDAGHPHIHIVSTTIRHDGTRISTHNIGRNQSEKARKETEKYFALISSQQKKLNKEKVVSSRTIKALYGKDETRKSIAHILEAVVSHYSYTSLTELNAILTQYNVTADRGKQNSNTYQKRGLYYRLLDGKGNKIGVPIKSSSLPNKPTLLSLEKRFLSNQSGRANLKQKFMRSLEDALSHNQKTTEDYKRLLEEKGISITFQNKREGNCHTVVLIDKYNKSAFDSKDLDVRYTQFLQSLLPNVKEDSKSLKAGNQSLLRVDNDVTQETGKQKNAKPKKDLLQLSVNSKKAGEINPHKEKSGKRNKGFVI